MDKVKLGSVMTLHRGYDLPNSQRKPGDIPVISSSGISGSHSAAKLDGENVVTGRYETIGEVFYYDGPCWPLNTTLYVEDFHGNDPKYVAYLLEVMLDALKIDGADKSTVPGVDRNVLHDLTVPYISDLVCQKSTTQVLTAIDDKIANNKKLMTELEATARLIYDYWFTQFDFPDEHGRPYRSSGGKMVWNEALKREIPLDWNVIKLGELFQHNRGISYTAKDLGECGTPIISLASIDRQGRYIPNAIKYYIRTYTPDKVLKPFDLIMANTDMTQEREVMGRIIFVPDIFDGDVLSTHHITQIHVKEELKSYLMMLSQSDWFHSYIKGYSSGTNVLGLDMIGYEEYKLVYPSIEVLRKFNIIIFNIYRRIFAIYREDAHLTSLRNWLLPLLMNGQATIGE